MDRVLSETIAGRDHGEPGPIASWKRYFYELIAAEISAFTRYYDAVIQWCPEPGDSLTLLSLIESPSKAVAGDEAALPDLCIVVRS